MTVSTAAQAIVDASAKRTAAIEANTAAIAALADAANNAGAQETEDLAAITTAMDAEDTAVAAQTAALPPPPPATPLVVTPTTLPTPVAETPYSVALMVSGGAAPYNATITGADATAIVTVDGSTVTVSDESPASGSYPSVAATITDSAGASVSVDANWSF